MLMLSRRDLVQAVAAVAASSGLSIGGLRLSSTTGKGAAPGGADKVRTTPPATPSAPSTPSGGPTTGGSPPPVVGPPQLRRGDAGPDVLQLQRSLAAAGYWPGTTDGDFGEGTWEAVVALQKVAGLARDGVYGPATRAALAAGTRPAARSRSGHVIEINLATQVLTVVQDGRVGLILATSTGSGVAYVSKGHRYDALTPPGSFTVYRSVNAWDPGPLGALYRPMYFNGGIAVHGLASVPAWPASHGCARVTLPAMDMLWRTGAIAVGTPVLVY